MNSSINGMKAMNMAKPAGPSAKMNSDQAKMVTNVLGNLADEAFLS